MTEDQYQKAIPVFCKWPTVEWHAKGLLFCWSIIHGHLQKAQGRGVEGPQFCHNCDESIGAKRWHRIWFKKMFGRFPVEI